MKTLLLTVVVALIFSFPVLIFSQSADQKAAMADRLFDEAILERDRKTPESMRAAQAKFRQIIDLFGQIGNVEGQGLIHFLMGAVFDRMHDPASAIESYSESVQIFRITGSKANEVLALNNLGLAYDAVGNRSKGLEVLSEALRIVRPLGHKHYLGTVLNNLGLVNRNLSNNREALRLYAEALRIRQELANTADIAITLNNIGQAYDDLGDRQSALAHYNRALPLRRLAADKAGEAITLSNIGTALDQLGDKRAALKHFNDSLILSRAAGDKKGQAITLNNIGKTYVHLGEPESAFKTYIESLELTRAVGNRPQEGGTLNNIGKLFRDLGDNQQALTYFEKALEILQSVKDKRGEAVALNNIGDVLDSMGQERRSLEYYNRSLPISRAIEDKRQEAITLNNIGRAHEDLGEIPEAIKNVIAALPLFRAISDKEGESVSLNNIGAFYRQANEPKLAVKHYTESLVLSRTIGNRTQEAITLSQMATLWHSMKRSRLASFYGKKSINLFQKLRADAAGLDQSLRQGLLRSNEHSYRYLADILLTDDRTSEALQLLNAFKNQQHYDVGTGAGAETLSLTPREARFSERYDKLSEQTAAITRQIESARLSLDDDWADRAKALEVQLQKLGDQLLADLNEVEADFSRPTDESDRIGDIEDVGRLQGILGRLPSGERAVAAYQLVAEEQFHILLVTDKSIKRISSPIKQPDFDERAKRFWGLLQSERYDPSQLGKELYDTIFKPMERVLPADTRTILWSLDRNLRYIPMAALFDGETYLLERFNHVTFTRTDTERLAGATSTKWAATALGSTRAHSVDLLGSLMSFAALPGVAAELGSIFSKTETSLSLDGEVLLDEQFNQKKMLATLAVRRPVVHIASHFSFRPGDDTRSFLLLGDGTAYTLADMKKQKNIFAGVELLTLSACNTAAQQADANGREVDAFFELAQRLGAQSVLATLWPVADNSTPWLMREFYAGKMNRTMNKAEALRSAQLTLIKGTAKAAPAASRNDASQVKIVISDGVGPAPETRAEVFVVGKKEAPPFKPDPARPFAHPFYWAPFVLIGNWQ